MKCSIVVEINQVRVGIIDLTSQTTAYLHKGEDNRILLVGTIRHQATMLSSIRSSMILIEGLVGTNIGVSYAVVYRKHNYKLENVSFFSFK
jgi:hypothetical protein